MTPPAGRRPLRAMLDRWVNPLHALLAVAVLVLLAGSPWLGMIKRVPPAAGLADLAHLTLGFASLALAAVYLLACTSGGRWRLYYPWAGGRFAALARDLAGVPRGRRPMSEGGGLFGTLEGLLLGAVLAAGATGAAWFALQGADGVLAARAAHLVAVRVAAGLLLLHLLAVATHLVDMLRG